MIESLKHVRNIYDQHQGVSNLLIAVQQTINT